MAIRRLKTRFMLSNVCYPGKSGYQNDLLERIQTKMTVYSRVSGITAILVENLSHFENRLPLYHSRNSIPDVGGQGQRKSGQLLSLSGLVLVRPDWQTTDKVFWKSGHRSESRQKESGQTDRPRIGFSGKNGQKRDTDRTRTVLSAKVCSIRRFSIGNPWQSVIKHSL